jgi:hypothetical protein
MITTRAMPALLPAHHRRVAEVTIKNDFADALTPGSGLKFHAVGSTSPGSTDGKSVGVRYSTALKLCVPRHPLLVGRGRLELAEPASGATHIRRRLSDGCL